MNAEEKRRRLKGRTTSGRFVLIPCHLFESESYVSLSSKSVKLLVEVAQQFNGKNNGDLCAPWSIMSKKYGWRSQQTLDRAKKELVEKGFLQVTRQGGLHQCTLYAVTWRNIDECRGKLDVSATTVPSNAWNKYRLPNTKIVARKAR